MEGGTAHGYGTISRINLCVYGVPPAPVYKGARGRGWPAQGGARQGVLLPPGVGFPPILVQLGSPEGKKGREGAGPFLLVLVGLGEGERRVAT